MSEWMTQLKFSVINIKVEWSVKDNIFTCYKWNIANVFLLERTLYFILYLSWEYGSPKIDSGSGLTIL